MITTESGQFTLTKAKAVVHRLFKFRLRSENELRAKLKEKKFPKDIIELTIEFFIKCGMIDDIVFTQSWIQSRLNKPIGLSRIKQELKRKGIADATIADELNRIKNNYDEDSAVEHIITKRDRAYRGLDRMKAKKRLEGYLLRRGFSHGTVYKFLRKRT